VFVTVKSSGKLRQDVATHEVREARLARAPAWPSSSEHTDARTARPDEASPARRRKSLRSLWVVGGLLILALPKIILAAPPPANALGVTMNVQPTGRTREDAVWLGYLLARARFIGDHRDLYEQKIGMITPLFSEEVEARATAVRIYHELQQENAEPRVAYFDDLDLAESSSFMREYVWTYLRQPTWENGPTDLKLAAFDAWRNVHLAGHEAITRGSVGFGETTLARKLRQSNSPGKDYSQLLLQGAQMLQQGKNPQGAIKEYFDPVISHYELIYKDGKSRVYSAENQLQLTLYAALPSDDKPVEVLDTVWGSAYLFKAYALSELKEFAGAQKALESAIALSPMNSQFLSELAYTYQVQKDCAKSTALYVQAASMAEIASDDARKTNHLTRAWRGQAYCLTEQGKLDQAEAMYRKCLALDPKDSNALRELEYIRRLRNK
jgi:hypothetical protein